MNIFSVGREYRDLRDQFEAHKKWSAEQIAALEKALQDTRTYCDRELAEIRENTPKRSSHHSFPALRRMAEEGAKRANG